MILLRHQWLQTAPLALRQKCAMHDYMGLPYTPQTLDLLKVDLLRLRGVLIAAAALSGNCDEGLAISFSCRQVFRGLRTKSFVMRNSGYVRRVMLKPYAKCDAPIQHMRDRTQLGRLVFAD